MKIGDRIKYIGCEDANKPYYPKYGTCGVIVSIGIRCKNRDGIMG